MSQSFFDMCACGVGARRSGSVQSTPYEVLTIASYSTRTNSQQSETVDKRKETKRGYGEKETEVGTEFQIPGSKQGHEHDQAVLEKEEEVTTAEKN